MLTDTKLKKLLGRKNEAITVISDYGGLNVRVGKTGKITFFYRYRWKSTPVQLSIGEYPTVSLVQAREKRVTFRNWLTSGRDPRDELKLERASSQCAPTVSDAFMYWIEKYCVPQKLAKTEYHIGVFNKHIKPVLGNLRISDTRLAHWLDAFESIDSGVMSNYMTTICKRAFNFCVNREFIDINPLNRISPKDVGIAPSKRDRYLSDGEISRVWEALKTFPDEARVLVSFIILTGCRTAEIRNAKWEWFDFDENTWTIPASEYKTGIKTRRALPDLAKKILLAHRENSNVQYVITKPIKGGLDTLIAPHTASRYAVKLANIVGMENWGLHDLRRTLATKLSEQGCPPHVVEKLLGHQMKGVMAHYNLHDYIEDQYNWLGVWERHICSIVNVNFPT